MGRCAFFVFSNSLLPPTGLGGEGRASCTGTPCKQDPRETLQQFRAFEIAFNICLINGNFGTRGPVNMKKSGPH